MMRTFCPALVLGLFFVVSARSQEPQLALIFPAGGQRGTSVDVTLEGKDLKETQSLFFSHAQISAKKVAENRFTVTIPASVAEGDYDVWAVTKTGLSNPRRWVVGSFPEVSEKDKNDEPMAAQNVQLPIVVNGKLDPGTDRDYYRFEAVAGQQVTMHFRSETLDYSARPAMTLFGPTGKELLHDDGRDAEPMLHFEASAAGAYVLKIEERSYQKGDNVYRLAIFTGPSLVAAHPQFLTQGKSQRVTLYGYGLAGAKSAGLQSIQADVKAPSDGDRDGGGWTLANALSLDAFRYHHPATYGQVRFGLTENVVTLAAENATTQATAQSVASPSWIAGRFLKPRQVDWYRVKVKKGDTFWLEAVGERDGKVMDLEIAIQDAKGKVLKTISDVVLKKGQKSLYPLDTFDPMDSWTALADGEIFIVVRDLHGTTRWGVTRTYRLHIGKNTGHVRVAALPAGVIPRGFAVAAGSTLTIPLIAERRGGHQAPIRVRALGLPPGLVAKETVIAKDQPSANLTITAAKDAKSWVGRLTLTAETEVDGKSTTLPVVGLTMVRPTVVRRCEVVAAVLGKGTP